MFDNPIQALALHLNGAIHEMGRYARSGYPRELWRNDGLRNRTASWRGALGLAAASVPEVGADGVGKMIGGSVDAERQVEAKARVTPGARASLLC
jgi:hypothetical protein